MAAAFKALKARAKRRMLRMPPQELGMPTNLSDEGAGVGANTVANLSVQKDSSAANGKALAKKFPKEPEYTLWYQKEVYTIYTHPRAQWLVALVIMANFVATIIEKEFDPYPPERQFNRDLWGGLDRMFTIIFLGELIINQYGKFFFFFWRDWWNVFDFFIVLVSILDMLGVLQGQVGGQLKMLRSFRVFRLFKRIQSLNKIVTSLFRAIPGVFNAFLIMFIVMCIYAILAVESFRDFGVEGEYGTEQTLMDANGSTYIERHNATSITAREMRMGQEYYGTFSRSLYTLFQVLTGESWAEAIARPLIFGLDPQFAFGPAIFFTSFILITQIVLVNVVVAVLLDKFVDDESVPSPPPATTSGITAAHFQKLDNDIRSIKEQLGDVVELKARVDALIEVLSTHHKLNA